MTRDFVVRRNWASAGGGAVVRSFTGPDFAVLRTGQALDDDASTVWSSDAVDAPRAGRPRTKQLVLALPADITITGIAIDPSPGCGDDATAQLAGYRVKVARDDDGDPGTFTTAPPARSAPRTGRRHATSRCRAR